MWYQIRYWQCYLCTTYCGILIISPHWKLKGKTGWRTAIGRRAEWNSIDDLPWLRPSFRTSLHHVSRSESTVLLLTFGDVVLHDIYYVQVDTIWKLCCNWISVVFLFKTLLYLRSTFCLYYSSKQFWTCSSGFFFCEIHEKLLTKSGGYTR